MFKCTRSVYKNDRVLFKLLDIKYSNNFTKKIKEYIANQLKEDMLSNQLTMEEFDPFKGQ